MAVRVYPENRAAIRRRVQERDGCWSWLGGHRPTGYGTFSVRRDGRVTSIPAHRAVYEVYVGPIAEGMTLDHLCRNRGCVNPGHLEQVTHAENVRRGFDARYAEVAA